VHGLAAIATALDDLRRGRGRHELVERWAAQVTGRGACRHPDGAARFVAGSLDVFAHELARHRRGGCGRRDLGVLPA
jgi:hypothetical protein